MPDSESTLSAGYCNICQGPIQTSTLLAGYCNICKGPLRMSTLPTGFWKGENSAQDYQSSGKDSWSNDSSLAYPGRGNISKVRGNKFSFEQTLDGHLNVPKVEEIPNAATPFRWPSSPITEDASVEGTTVPDHHKAASSEQTTSFLLQSRDLPSKRLLGQGLTAIGYETTWKGERFARKDFIGVPRDIFEKEAGVLVGLKDHKNIVKTHGWTVDKRSCSLVLEYIDDDLLSLLQQKTDINLSEALDTMLQIARGMESLHEQGVAHGDLKTKNILVTCGDQNSKVVKVSDFGLVWTKRKSQSKVSPKVRKLNIVQWKAPECIEILYRPLNLSNNEDGTSSESDSDSESNKTSSPSVANVSLSRIDVFAADVYSFGVICSQILTNKDSYPILDWIDLGNKILSGLRPHLPDACPSFLRDILKSCWSDSTQRPKFSIIRHSLEQMISPADLVVERLLKNFKDDGRRLIAKREAWAKGREGWGMSSSEERSKNSIVCGGRPNSVWKLWSKPQDEVTSGQDLHRPGARRKFNGVHPSSQKSPKPFVAEMRPPGSRNTIFLGYFDSPIKAAGAVDAAFYHYGRPDMINFVDTPLILSKQPKSTGLDEKDKLGLVKKQSEMLASIRGAQEPDNIAGTGITDSEKVSAQTILKKSLTFFTEGVVFLQTPEASMSIPERDSTCLASFPDAYYKSPPVDTNKGQMFQQPKRNFSVPPQSIARKEQPQQSGGRIQRFGMEGGQFQRAVSERFIKDKSSNVKRVMYEPRFKPPPEKSDSGGTLLFPRLYLGAYNTQRDAEIVHQIAAFYYGKDEGKVELEDGTYFDIPPMSEQERSLSGMDRAKWVSATAKKVYAVVKSYADVKSEQHQQLLLNEEILKRENENFKLISELENFTPEQRQQRQQLLQRQQRQQLLQRHQLLRQRHQLLRQRQQLLLNAQELALAAPAASSAPSACSAAPSACSAAPAASSECSGAGASSASSFF